jgi:hypothetical protein
MGEKSVGPLVSPLKVKERSLVTVLKGRRRKLKGEGPSWRVSLSLILLWPIRKFIPMILPELCQILKQIEQGIFLIYSYFHCDVAYSLFSSSESIVASTCFEKRSKILLKTMNYWPETDWFFPSKLNKHYAVSTLWFFCKYSWKAKALTSPDAKLTGTHDPTPIDTILNAT